MTRFKFILLCLLYSFNLIAILFYSFTQADLNLTLSNNIIFQQFQSSLINIGFYQRTLSVSIFILLFVILFLFYLYFIWLSLHKKFTVKKIWILILLTVIILIFSYPAFSYDIYNYIFDAKITYFYKANPYIVKPLDFPTDPWIRFMRWTHRPSVYPPIWIGISGAPFLLGFNKFVLTLLNFKIFISLFYLFSIYIIGKIVNKINPENKNLSIILFAFNPLIISECLISSHNDIAMISFALLSLYYLLEKKLLTSILFFIISIGIKFVSFVLLPIWIIYLVKKKRHEDLNWSKILPLCLYLMIVGTILVLTQTKIQPWYFIWIFPFSLFYKKLLGPQLVFLIGLSIGLLARYIPYLYIGTWNNQVLNMETNILFFSAIFSLFASLIIYKRNKKV